MVSINDFRAPVKVAVDTGGPKPRMLPLPRTPSAEVAVDFGAKFGSEILNKSQAAKLVNKAAVGTNRAPDVELLMRDAILGHIAVRYRNPDTKKMECVNIRLPLPGDIAAGKDPLVHFTNFDDMMWGLKDEAFDHGYLWGQYNGDYMGLRLENVDADKLRALHAKLTETDRRSREGKAVFDLRMPVVKNKVNSLKGFFRGSVPKPKWARKVFANTFGRLRSGKSASPADPTEYGNCSLYVAKALAEAGIIKKPTMFPRKLFAEVYRQNGGKGSPNVNVVHYARMTHAHGDMAYIPTRSITSPLDVRHWREFWDLAKLADVRAEVPMHSQTLVARRRDGGPDGFRA